MERHHVYCTCCIYGNKLINSLYKKDRPDDPIEASPLICRNCYPWNLEDSRSSDLRKNYKESLSGWWWLTKQEIKDWFMYTLYKICKIQKGKE